MSTSTKPAIPPIAVIGLLFFVMGWFTWLNGPLISFVRLAFELDVVDAFLVTFVFYLSYFVWALPASYLLDATGMKKGLAVALWIMAAGALAFGEFCTRRWYPGALAGLFVIAAGLAVLQTAANPYISILGPIDSAARRIAVMGICNKAAGALAPLVLGAVAMSGMDEIAAIAAAAEPAARDALLDRFAAGIHAPYLAMAALLGVAGLGILFSPLPDLRSENAAADAAGASDRLRQHPHVWLGALAIFACVGTEVMAGDAIGTYASELGLPLDQSKYFTTGTLVAMLAGYVAGFVLSPAYVSQQRYLAASALLGMVLTVAAALAGGYVAIALIAALGFANAMMWPSIFPLGIAGLGPLIKRGSALLIMGICGGALVPQLFAVLRTHYDFRLVFAALMIACYLYILYFALHGHRAGRREAPPAA